jgi:RNA polymerase sigma factor (TIGR02999 family)
MSDSDALPNLVARVRAGDREARDELFTVVYDELRLKARLELARAGRASLSTTVVLHEAYVKLRGAERLTPEDQGHFMRIAARAMRSVIIDRARRRLSKKRGGDQQLVDLNGVEVAGDAQAESLVALDDALLRLEGEDPRLAEVVHLRYFAGMSIAETAAALGVSERTVKRDWRLARAILHAELTDDAGTEDGPR